MGTKLTGREKRKIMSGRQKSLHPFDNNKRNGEIFLNSYFGSRIRYNNDGTRSYFIHY